MRLKPDVASWQPVEMCVCGVRRDALKLLVVDVSMRWYVVMEVGYGGVDNDAAVSRSQCGLRRNF